MAGSASRTQAARVIERLTVLHLDKDFEIIAEVTGQPIERLVIAADT